MALPPAVTCCDLRPATFAPAAAAAAYVSVENCIGCHEWLLAVMDGCWLPSLPASTKVYIGAWQIYVFSRAIVAYRL
jgi:hypothetical protein